MAKMPEKCVALMFAVLAWIRTASAGERMEQDSSTVPPESVQERFLRDKNIATLDARVVRHIREGCAGQVASPKRRPVSRQGHGSVWLSHLGQAKVWRLDATRIAATWPEPEVK